MPAAFTPELLIQASYLLTAFLFIVGLKRMSSPVSARSGILWAGAGMVVATAATFFFPGMGNFALIGIAIAIGSAIAGAGLGVFLMQTPAGVIVDRVRQRRALLASASILLGLCYGLVPFLPAQPALVNPILFIAGTAQAFFVPLLGAQQLACCSGAQQEDDPSLAIASVVLSSAMRIAP